jgi:hypothetical protein
MNQMHHQEDILCSHPECNSVRAAVYWADDQGIPLPRFRAAAEEDLFLEWLMMLSRCYNPADPDYPFEGARGIEVCDQWNPQRGGSFENFLFDNASFPYGVEV